MKQAHHLTVGHIISGSLCWNTIVKPARISLQGVKHKIVERIDHYRSIFTLLATIFFIGVLFLAGSYLFLMQLAQHGW